MKKAILLGCLFFLIAPFCFSQKSFGVKAGLNVSRLEVNVPYIQKVKNRVGYHLGIWKEFTTNNPTIFFRPELFYTQKGFRNNDTLTSPLTNRVIRYQRTSIFNYLTLPLLVGYRLNSNIAIFAGPEISTLIVVRSKTKGEKAYNMRPILDYDNLDLGLTAGFRYNLTGKLSADLRYTYGFSTIMQYEVTDAQGNTYAPKQSHNQAAQLGLSYRLKMKLRKV